MNLTALFTIGGAALLALVFGGGGMGGGGRAPRGKGLFLRSTGHAGSPDALIARCREMGVTWVMLPVIWQKTTAADIRYDGKIDQYAAALKAAGITVWIWGWPEPSKHAAFSSLMLATRARIGAAGICINAEKPWFGHNAEAAELAAAMRGQNWALSSYGGAYNFPSFPWAEFSSAPIGMPQIYDTKHNLGDGYPAKSVKKWRELGFKTIAPTLGASSAHSPAQIVDIAERTIAVGGIGALSWWDFYHLNQSSGRRGAVAAVTIPGAEA